MRLIFDEFPDGWEPIVYRQSNHVVTRPYGSMPFSRPAPHDKTMLEIDGKCEEDTSELYEKCLSLYLTGYYKGDGSWDKFHQDLVMLGRDDWQGKALRRRIKDAQLTLEIDWEA